MGTLRCSSCGAPLQADATSQIITCQYRGVSQQRVDAEKYDDQLRTDVYRWVQSMVPVGVQGAGQIDTVARAQIFESSIRQGVEAEAELHEHATPHCLLEPAASPALPFRAFALLHSQHNRSQDYAERGRAPPRASSLRTVR